MSRILFVTEINKTMLLSGGMVSFGPLWLAAVLKRKGHQCDITAVNYKEAERMFKSFNPHIVAYTAFSGGHIPMVELNKKLKKKFNFYSMFGGPHPTFSPEMIEERGIDAVCRGEGFEAMAEFVNKLEKGEDITKIQNFWVKVNNKIYKNPLRPLLKNLDVLPFPDRSLIEKYRAYRVSKTASMMTSIGCPFKCTYCFNHQLHKLRQKGDPILRQRSVDNVIEELKQLMRSNPKVEHIMFRDDILIINKDWGKEFAEKYSREIGLRFLCQARPGQITEEIADYLKKAGVYTIAMGIESGNDYLRNEILGRAMSKEQIINGLKILHDRKINIYLNNIIGIPHETLDTALETWELNKKFRPAFAESSLLMPYPKTDIYNYAVANGFLDPNIKYPPTIHEKIILKLKDKKRLENFHQLFGIAVEFPFLISFIKILIKLPLRPLYNAIRKFWKGYCFTYRFYPYRISLLENIRVIYDEIFISKV